MADRPEALRPGESAEALAELAACENLAQTAAWAAHWCAAAAGAEAAAIWAPDPLHPVYSCVGVHGTGGKPFRRRTAERGAGLVLRLLRSRDAAAMTHREIAGSTDPLLAGAPEWVEAALAVPLEAETGLFFLLCLFYRKAADAAADLEGIGSAARTAAAALARALRAERKSAGMLHAIERLTNLYDISKAFGSTLDAAELSSIIVRKAADLTTGESASLWLLDTDSGEVVLSGTAINENYDVEAGPDAVGSAVVGDVVSEKANLRRNGIPDGDPSATEEPAYQVRSLLAAPLIDEDEVEGAIVVANKRGRRPEFSEEDEELLQDLARQAIRALRNARRYQAEKKVEELDALLAVSREITSTLDLDRVMQTVVNAASALITYDRCSLAIQDRGRLRLGAVSGVTEIDRKDTSIRRTEDLLQWVFLSGSDVNVTQKDDGTLAADRPETEEKFRSYFQDSGNHAFYGATLKDEEGKLGVLGFECADAVVFDEETRDLLAILMNQATVALRNAQLYRQVPLVGFWKPVADRWRRLLGVPQGRAATWGTGAFVLLAILFLVPWRFRIVGPARLLPGNRTAVTVAVDGQVASVLRREGDVVSAGDVIASLRDERYRASLAQARAAYEVAASDVARHQESGDAGALFEAQSRRDEWKARMAMEEERLERTRLKAPTAGVIVTPRLEERVGQVLEAGTEFCVVADVGTVTAEIAVPEQESAFVREGQKVELKFNPYPTRTYEGEVTRVGARIREDGKERFVVTETRIGNSDGSLRVGMVGKGKVRAGTRRIATLLLRKPARWLYQKLWPLLP